jgi:hypothetical protein
LTDAAASTFQPYDLTNAGGALYFVANDQLWTSDGSAAGTHAAAVTTNSLSGMGDISGINGHLFFVANDGIHPGAEPMTLVPFNGLLATGDHTLSAVASATAGVIRPSPK